MNIYIFFHFFCDVLNIHIDISRESRKIMLFCETVYVIYTFVRVYSCKIVYGIFNPSHLLRHIYILSVFFLSVGGVMPRFLICRQTNIYPTSAAHVITHTHTHHGRVYDFTRTYMRNVTRTIRTAALKLALTSYTRNISPPLGGVWHTHMWACAKSNMADVQHRVRGLRGL